MDLSELQYDLPPELIAARPLPTRSASRLLRVPRSGADLEDTQFTLLPQLLRAGDLLVVNDTRVINARLLGQKMSGGGVELLLTDPVDARRWWVLAKGTRRLKIGAQVVLQDASATLLERGKNGRVLVEFSEDALALAERIGHVPLPPYIARPDENADRARYQTLFAKNPGAVAAPTAALHFDDAVLAQLAAAQVEIVRLTLHVGPGTFQPVRCEHLEDHRMDAERYIVGDDVVHAVTKTKKRGGRVIAVGTTSTRALESCADGQGGLRAGSGQTELFITPGYCFQVIDGLLTNFHLPGSTLLALVMALASRQQILRAYHHAVSARYRFYSYGDCMLII